MKEFNLNRNENLAHGLSRNLDDKIRTAYFFWSFWTEIEFHLLPSFWRNRIDVIFPVKRNWITTFSWFNFPLAFCVPFPPLLYSRLPWSSCYLLFSQQNDHMLLSIFYHQMIEIVHLTCNLLVALLYCSVVSNSKDPMFHLTVHLPVGSLHLAPCSLLRFFLFLVW